MIGLQQRLLRFGIGCLGGLLWLTPGSGQDMDLPLSDPAYRLLDRLEIRGEWAPGPERWHTFVKPYPREWAADRLAAAHADSLSPETQRWLALTRWRLSDTYPTETLSRERVEQLRVADTSLWYGSAYRYVYQNRRDLLSNGDPQKVFVAVNPILHLRAGQASAESGSLSRNLSTYQNTRGASLRIRLLGKVGLFGQFTENQVRFPEFVEQRIADRQIVPGTAFNKRFKEDGWDYLNAKAYLTYSPAEFLRLKLGRDQMRLGQGFQSLQLSDHAVDQYFLNLNARFWQFQYVAHYAQLIDYIPGKSDVFGAQPRKYYVFHQLNWQPDPRLEVGVFESVMYEPEGASGQRGFELQYLNPLIFYRTAEQFVGSPDNGSLGLNAKVNLLKRIQVYGQGYLDDFNLARSREGENYWGNTLGLQFGAKAALELLQRPLDLQVEYNRIRPYVYAHYNVATNYTHYGQPLAHPLGANLTELTGLAHYQVHPRLELALLVGLTNQGRDTANLNVGADPFLSNVVRDNGTSDAEFGQAVGQGAEWEQLRVDGRISYELWHLNLFLDVEAHLRQQAFLGDTFTETAFGVGLRWNVPYRWWRF